MRKTGLLLTCALAVALAVPVATATAAKPRPAPAPAFRVTIHGTMGEHDLYALAGDASCPWSARGDATRQLEIRNAAPLTMTAAQLGDARNGVFELLVTETRTASHSDAEFLCPGAGPDVSDPTTTCGTVTYKVGSIGTGVGFSNSRSSTFWLFYTRISTDLYAGGCASHVWGIAPTPGSSGKVWIDGFPPDPDHIHNGTTIDRSRLLAHKKFTVSWRDSTQTGPDAYGDVETQSASWQVTLDPVS